MPRISCIIPAYNEEQRLAGVLTAVQQRLGTTLLEVIVVDDHSNDRTADIAASNRNVIVIRHEQNTGKSGAFSSGLRVARGEFILMLDGDLIGLTPEHIDALTSPVMTGESDTSISIRANTPSWWITLFRVETWSGERCFARAVVAAHVNEIAQLKGYALETYINDIIVKHNMRIASVRLSSVVIDYKWHKFGLLSGIKKEIGMWVQIFSYAGPLSLIRQVIAMRRLSKL